MNQTRIKCLFNRCSRCNSDEEIEKAIHLSRAELESCEQEEIRRRSLSANRRLECSGNQIRRTSVKVTPPVSEMEPVKGQLRVNETDAKPFVSNNNAEVSSDKPPRIGHTPAFAEPPKLLYSDIIKKPKPDPKASSLPPLDSAFPPWPKTTERPVYTVLGDQCTRPKLNQSDMELIQPLPIDCTTNNPVTDITPNDIQNNAPQETFAEPTENTNAVDISPRIIPLENVEILNVVIEQTENGANGPSMILPANPPCNPLVTLKKDFCIPLAERSSRIYNAQKLIDTPMWLINQKEPTVENNCDANENAQLNTCTSAVPVILIPDTNLAQPGNAANNYDHLPPKTEIVVQQRVEPHKKSANKPPGRQSRTLPSSFQVPKTALPVNKQHTANSRNRPAFKGINSQYIMQNPKQSGVKESFVQTFQSHVQNDRATSDKPESKISEAGAEVKFGVGQTETKSQKKKSFSGYKRAQNTSSNGGKRSSQVAHVDSEGVEEIKRLAKAGCIKAEAIAMQHQMRPCFKNLHHLCSRARVDLEKPDITVANIYSQGMPWATKDFLFAFIRMANSWVIMKGYLCIYNNNLAKIEKCFSSGLRASFVKWQMLSKEMMTHLLETFRNLEKESSRQPALHHTNRKHKKTATKTVNSTKNVKSVSQSKDINTDGLRNKYGTPSSTKYKPYRGFSKQNRPKQNKTCNALNSELDTLQNNVKSSTGKKNTNLKHDYTIQNNIFENTTSNIISDSVNNNAWMQFCTHLLGKRDFEEVNKPPVSNNGAPLLSETFFADNTKVFNRKEEAATTGTANGESILNPQSGWSSVPSTSSEFLPPKAYSPFPLPPGHAYEWNPPVEGRDAAENNRKTSEPPKPQHSGRMQRPHSMNQPRREYVAYGPDYRALANKKSTDFYNNLAYRPGYGPMNAAPELFTFPDANKTDYCRADTAPRYSDILSYGGGGEPSRTRNVATYGLIPWSLGEEPKFNNYQGRVEFRNYEQRQNLYPPHTFYNRNSYYRNPNAGEKPRYKKPHKTGNGIKLSQAGPNSFAKSKDATHKPNTRTSPHPRQKWDNRKNK